MELVSTEVKNKINETLEYLKTIVEIQISSDDEYNNATNELKSIKSFYNNLEKERKDIVNPKNKEIKDINNFFKTATVPLLNGERNIKSAMAKFHAEKERKRIEEQKRLEAIEQERIRKAEEKARKEQEKAELYRQQGKEKLAEMAEARAETQEEIINTSVAPVIQETKTKGVTYLYDCDLQIIDNKQAIDSLMSSPFTSCYVLIDIANLKKEVKLRKGKIEIPGIKIIDKKTVSVRA